MILIEKQLLERLYIDEGKTTIEIAKIVGCSQERVWHSMEWFSVPRRGKGPRKKLLTYFLGSIEDNTNECIEWPYSRTNHGYGRLSVNGKYIEAHRLAYLSKIGPLGDGECACHRCNNPPCFNPRHLYRGSKPQNSADAVRDGLYKRGSSHPAAKLTDKIVREARERYSMGGVTIEFLASLANVGCSTMLMALRGKTWRHVT